MLITTDPSRTALLINLATASLAALGAVVVYVFGRLLEQIFIAPLSPFREVRGQVASKLMFYANASGFKSMVTEHNREEIVEYYRAGREELRNLAGELRAKAIAIPCYGFWVRVRLVPSLTDLDKACDGLIGKSNSLHDSHAPDTTPMIAEALRLRIPGKWPKPTV